MSPSLIDMIQLQLEEDAWEAAREFTKAHPDAEIVSGRRTLTEQASAMAGNVLIAKKGVLWLQIYKYKPIRNALIAWCKDNPTIRTHAELSAGFLAVLRTFREEELHRLSVHFTGLAFDVRPVDGQRGHAMLSTLRSIMGKYGGILLEEEGGLKRWHCQFKRRAA